MKLTEYSRIKKKNKIMITLVMQLLKMEVEDLEEVLVVLVERIFRIFLRTSLEILVVVAVLEAEELITEGRT